MENKYQEASKILLAFLASTAKEKRITQKEIAEKTGLLQTTISKLFSGKRPISMIAFLKICEAVGVNVFLEDKNALISDNQWFIEEMKALRQVPKKDQEN